MPAEALDLVQLSPREPGVDSAGVDPRWPDRVVVIDPGTWRRVCVAQLSLPDGVKLVVTRAYQPERSLHGIARSLGALLFGIVYAGRRAETLSIFGHNGHAADGTHVDVSVQVDGRSLRLLPLGAFTPLFLVERAARRHAKVLADVRVALAAAGLEVHANPTEALQIHCDLRVASPVGALERPRFDSVRGGGGLERGVAVDRGAGG